MLPIILLAQAITPELVGAYANLGAATMTLDAMEKRDLRRACTHAKHHLELAQAMNRPTGDILRTVNTVCGWQ
jgi:hypothetical protein